MMKISPRPSPFSQFLTKAIAGLVAILMLQAGGLGAESNLTGHWEGEIEIPDQPLQIAIDFTKEDTGWSGTIDIPAQGAQGLPLEMIHAADDRLQFRIVGVPGGPTFDGTQRDGRISGTFTQGGAELTFSLSRDVIIEKPKRPQEPTGPFPYSEEEASYKNGDIQLAGTLTLPAGEGPHPAVVLISGSGSQNRDSELMGHKPFWILADHLTRAGVAVLRVDDRGVGGSSGKVRESTSSDFANDVLTGVRWLSKHPSIAPDRIGLVGHSEGGLIAPIAASRSQDVAFAVLLAGPGVPAMELLPLQTELLLRAQGLPEDQIQKTVQANQKVLEQLGRSESEDDSLRSLLKALVLEENPKAKEDPKSLERAIEDELRKIDNPWFRFFLDYDPASTLRKVKVPILALNGSLDLQVDAQQNLPRIEQALKEAGNPDVTVVTLEGLNHLFQPAKTGAVAEYSQIEVTFDPEALEQISNWINARFTTPEP